MGQISNMKPVLQYRWKMDRSGSQPTLLYYGLRNYPRHQDRVIGVRHETAELIDRFDGSLGLSELGEATASPELERLIQEGIIVDVAERRKPATPATRRTCVRCVNDDYVLPGLEFDRQGVCAFCQCFEKADDPGPLHGGTVTESDLLAASGKRSGRFDVMVLYTGGKDSSFLLWYLARKLGLNVLACTWDMPFTNESSRANARSARERLPNVEFLERTVRWTDIQRVSKNLFDATGLPCICPILSSVLFYPYAVIENIPFVLDGVEAAQTLILSKVMGLPAKTGAAGLSEAKLTLRQVRRYLVPDLDSGDPWDHFLTRVREELGSIYDPLAEALKRVDPAHPPLVKRLQTEQVYGTWADVRKIIESELGWRMPEGQEGLLHTSCDIETVKDWSQLRRFADMRTMQMPQSIIEISAAVHLGLITRDKGLMELAERGYYEQPRSLAPLMARLGLSLEEAQALPGELPCVVKGCRF